MIYHTWSKHTNHYIIVAD